MGSNFSNEYYQYPDLCTCRNPNGRTGLRGRGKLWRWGPNHCVKVVISRWKRFKPQNDFIKVNDKRVMEVIVLQKRASGELTLPEASKLNLFSFRYLVVHVYHSYWLSKVLTCDKICDLIFSIALVGKRVWPFVTVFGSV